MSSDLHERLLVELRTVATQPRSRTELSLRQTGDVMLLVQPLRPDNNSEALAAIINQLPLSNFVDRRGAFTAEPLGRVTRSHLRIRWMGETVLELLSCGRFSPQKKSARSEPGTEVTRLVVA